MVDEGNRCPFLLENDDSKIVTCMCNYYSLGQSELARALLHIVATKNLPRALRIAKTIIWHGPPKHWLCSVFVPSSAHLAWLCLIDFQDLVETHVHKPAELPPWLVKRLEFDVLIAQALLDGAAIQAQVLTAEVASELRAYHAGLLSATSGEIPLSFKLPALSLLQVTTQVSPYVNFLPAHTSDRQEQLEHFSGGGAGLSKNAVQQLYDLCKSQPLLGRCISLALAPAGCTAALKTARQIQQMCLGLTADALLQSLKNGDAWRYLKFLEVSDTVGVPPPLIELFSILLIVVVSNVRPTPALHTRLQALVSMSTSTVNTMGSSGRVDQGNTSNGDADGSSPRSLLANAHAVASQTLSEVFAQAMPPEGSVGVKPWEHLRQFAGSSGASAGSYSGPGSGGTSAPRSSAMHFSRFLNRIRGDKDDSTQAGAKGALDALDEGLRNRGDVGSQNQRSAQSAPGSAQWKGGAAAEELAARLGKHRGDVAETWEAEGPVEAARIAFLYRTKIYEAFLTHDSSGTHTALRLFSILEDEFLRLKSVQSPLPPAFELLQPADAASYLFEVPPITFWDAYFEFTRVASAHCLEYVVQTAVNFIRTHDFGASAWLLAPFPQLKPLVILLCWPEFQGDVESRQSLLDTVWKSYTEETKCDPTTTGDLLVDYMVEVLNYRLSVSWWISKLIASQDNRPGSGSGGTQVQNYRAGALDRTSDRPRSKDEKTGAAATAGSYSAQTALPQIAAGVLSQVTTHSILYVMRPNLPAVQSVMLLDALQSLPPLRQAAAASEHSYDLDLTRCYYTVRCAMFLVERCVHTPGSKAPHESLTPGRQVIQEGMDELDRLISSIERTPLKVSVFLLISSLCFARQRHLDASRKAPGTSPLRGATPASGTSVVGGGAASDFLVPPSVLLSLLSLLKHHLQPLVAHCKSGSTLLAEPPGSADSIKGADEQLLQIIVRLHQFTEETIWRIFISLKDFFMYSQLARSEGSIQLKPAQRMEHAALDWPDAVGAVIIGDLELVEIFDEMHMVEPMGSSNSARMPTEALREVTAGDESSDAHPFLQLCTPMEVPLSLQPLTFIPRMLSSPLTLLHRSLKMNDYLLSRRLLQYFPDLQRIQCNATVQIAERFKDLRKSLVGVGAGVDVEEVLSDDILEAQLGDAFESKLNELIAAIKCVGTADENIRASREAGEEEESLLSSLSGPLLAFYVFMDLAVSAAPFVQMSTHLLKKAVDSLCNKEMTKVSNPALLPDSDSLLSFFQKRIERLRVLVEVRPEFKGRATLAAIILGIETLPSEPALLKSHLNRMHSQRNAIMSLVESVDLVKKGQTSASQRTLVDFLSSAIKSLTNEEEDSSRAVTDTDAPDQRDDADQMAEGLGASRYLLRFLEYLTKVADLMHSASIDAQARKPNKKTPVQEYKKEKREGTIDVVLDTGATEGAGDVPDEGVEVTKLFDVLAETPKGIVARLLFELGGRKQALALSEVMNVDLVEVIVNSSWVLPVWNQHTGRRGRHSLRDSGVNSPHYPASMEVVLYLAQHESPLPQVRNPEAPLLAMMACLERRGRHWPSWRMLNFAKEQSLNRFPALHRWVEERCHALRAIQWADKRNKSGKPNGTAILSSQASSSEGPERHGQDQPADDGDDLEASEKSEDADADDDRLEFSSGEALALRKKHGYTDVELQNLGVEDRLALEAIGGDHEAGMSAAYTKLVHAFIAESRNEEALQVCDEFLPFDSNLIDKVLHLYLKSSEKEHEEHDPTLFHSALLDHECMYRVKRNTLAAQLTLERYKHWDITTAVQTVSMCLQRMEMDSSNEAGLEVHSLKLELKRILQKMITFEKILQVSGGRWRVWQEIEDMSKEQVSGAVDHLLALQQHDLARTLTQMYGMTDPLHSLELSRLHYLFTKKNDKTSAINHLLLLPPAQAVSFALQLLNMFDLIHHRVLLCRMLLTRLHSWLSEKEDQRLRVLHASLQLLGVVSETMQPHFLRLLRKPVLIVESLLMNARVDLLKPFLSDFPEYRHDKLILRYARKALALSPTPPGSLGMEVPLQEDTAVASDGEESKEKFVAGSGLGGAWCLTGDSAEDRQLREEHVFKEAPSINLAEQILELCSDLPENASSCFEICNELSLRLHDLTPKYAVTGDGSPSAFGVDAGDQSGVQPPASGTADAAGNGTGSEDTGSVEKPDAPLSVRLVTFMIRRLLTYLQQKFRGAGAEIQVQLDRSLNNLSFIPLLWQISGHKVGLSELCNPEKAAALRDELIKEDQLSLALELCERCSGEGKAREADEESGIPLYSEDADAAWHISADPVREAKAVALQKLHRYAEARQEFSQTEAAMPHSAKSTLNSFENAMRYPQLFDLNALGNMQSLYTFNSLQRKLYRSTAQLPALPSILLMGNTPMDSGSSSLDVSAGGQQTRRGQSPGFDVGGKLPIPKVPVVPFGHPVNSSSVWPGEAGKPREETGGKSTTAVANGKGNLQLQAMEECMRSAVRQRTRRRWQTAASGKTEAAESQDIRTDGTSSKSDRDEGWPELYPHSKPGTVFANAVTYLYPPIHSPELPSWSPLTETLKSTKAHTSKEGAPAGEAPPEEARPAINPPEDKERPSEEAAVVNEAEMDGAKPRDEEGETSDAMPEVSYSNRMMDATLVCCGCGGSQNLRSQSSLWPEDNHTHSLLQASPMALPLAVPHVVIEKGERLLHNVAFNELLYFQENYGTAESLLSMLVRERHLTQACYYIFTEKVSKRLFVDVVAHHCLAHNQIHELQKVILDFDPSLRRVQEYLSALKDFLRDRRALDLLYSYQVFTKDFVNAGLLAIQLFIASNTWDARVGHLQNALAHLSDAHKQYFGRKNRSQASAGQRPDTDSADAEREGTVSHGVSDSTVHGSTGEGLPIDGISGLEVTEAEIRRNLEIVRLQISICEAMPTEIPHSVDLFGPISSQCEVAERLLVVGYFDLAQRVIDFLDLPIVELCVRASNQIATTEARSPTGSIIPVVRFLEAIPKLPPVEWDSLVSNVVNIWIIEKAELQADPSAANQLIKFVQDERCRMDALVLTGNLNSAFQIAQRLGNLQDVLHIRSCAQKSGDQELLKMIHSFLATSRGRDYFKANMSF